jgi:hypothetical protein
VKRFLVTEHELIPGYGPKDDRFRPALLLKHTPSLLRQLCEIQDGSGREEPELEDVGPGAVCCHVVEAGVQCHQFGGDHVPNTSEPSQPSWDLTSG